MLTKFYFQFSQHALFVLGSKQKLKFRNTDTKPSREIKLRHKEKMISNDIYHIAPKAFKVLTSVSYVYMVKS